MPHGFQSNTPSPGSRRELWAWALATLAASLAVTLWLWASARQAQEQRDRARVERFMSRTEANLRIRLGRFEDLARGAQGFLAGNPGPPTAAQWRAYVEPLDLARRHPGLSELDWSLPDQGAAGPLERAVAQARDTGRTSVSGLLTFEPGASTGVALLLPVYRGRPEDLAGRRQAFRAWVSARICMKPLMDDLLRGEDQGLALELVEPGGAEGPRALFRTEDWPLGQAPAGDRRLYAGGRLWRLDCALKPDFFQAPGRNQPLILLWGCLAVSLSLTLVTAAVLSTRRRALALARAMTQSLHRAQARYRNHMKGTPVAVFETDSRFRIQEWNPAAERIFGYSRAEMLGQDPILLLPAEDHAAMHARRKAYREGGNQPVRSARVLLSRSGERRLCDLSITPLMDDAGHFEGAVYMADDITDRKRAEEALSHAQKMESLGVLAGGIAHDFNNLLTAVMGNTELAMLRSQEDPAQQAALGRVMTAAQRGADLSQQLLAYAGKGRFAMKPQAFNRLIEGAGAKVAEGLPGRIRLGYDLEPGLPAVEADASQIQQAVVNLVRNAAEAIGEGEGAITLRTRSAFLGPHELQMAFPERLPEPGTYVRLDVKDEGAGMGPDTLGRVFEPFFTSKSTGRGLGLSAVIGILRIHGGGIRVESAQGAGTTFSLFFPASPLPVALPAPEAPASKVPRTVLVVDDEEFIREIAERALIHAGYRVLQAQDGQEALAWFLPGQDPVDLVLLDMTMPRMGGAEAFRRIRAVAPETRVLLSSGYTQKESLQSLAGLPPDGFLAKPYRIADLLAAVADTLRRPAVRAAGG
jgi:PAS domain S-box-containing protein